MLISGVFMLFFSEDPLGHFPDEKEYMRLADKALQGNFDFDLGRFIRSPGYPFLLVILKWIFGGVWLQAALAVNWVMQGLATWGILRLGQTLFGKVEAAISALLFAVYLPCFFYIGAISTESVFLANIIWLAYFMVVSRRERAILPVIWTGLLFTSAYFLRSQVMLFAPFILLEYVWYRKDLPLSRKLVQALVFLAIPVLLTIPWGLNNKALHGSYITSSNGGAWVFLLGNSETAYAIFMQKHDVATRDYKYLMDLSQSVPDELGVKDYNSLPVQERERLAKEHAFHWISENPVRFLKLKTILALRFFLPGLDFNHNSLARFLSSLLFSLPFYLFGLWGMITSLHRNIREHRWVVGYAAGMFLLLVGILFSTRFRTYGMEPFYVLYAGVGIMAFIKRWMPEKLNASETSSLPPD